MSNALGMIETKGLVGAIEAADAMTKSANVQLKQQLMLEQLQQKELEKFNQFMLSLDHTQIQKNYYQN